MKLRAALAAALLIAAAASSIPTSSGAWPLAGAPRCKIFPSDNHWNLRVDQLPVKDNSDEIVASIGVEEGLHADFGSGRWQGAPIGIPINVVGRSQRLVPVRFTYADESDRGPYPIPRMAKIEGGRHSDGDRHVLVVDKSRCKLYELSPRIHRTATAGSPDPGLSGIWARTGCALRAGRPQTRPGFRSSPGWLVIATFVRAGSITPCALPCPAAAERSSIPHGTTRQI
jgi:hypothetical protein